MTESVVEIIGLSKRFGAGVLAVDDLSFSVEQGQVFGLLGPNGAGKTTCLRMLLGLIRPSGGETRLFGAPVTPGSDQLRRLGALIESSAFVPHLSGTRNLRLWWEAGGGRWADADVDTALAIADLGTAVDRKVKTLVLAKITTDLTQEVVQPMLKAELQAMLNHTFVAHTQDDKGATTAPGARKFVRLDDNDTASAFVDEEFDEEEDAK